MKGQGWHRAKSAVVSGLRETLGACYNGWDHLERRKCACCELYEHPRRLGGIEEPPKRATFEEENEEVQLRGPTKKFDEEVRRRC